MTRNLRKTQGFSSKPWPGRILQIAIIGEQRFNHYELREKPAPGKTPGRYVSTEPAEPAALDNTDEGEFVLFYRTGLQRKVIRKLKRGEYPCQAELDLHGMTTRQADEALSDYPVGGDATVITCPAY